MLPYSCNKNHGDRCNDYTIILLSQLTMAYTFLMQEQQCLQDLSAKHSTFLLINRYHLVPRVFDKSTALWTGLVDIISHSPLRNAVQFSKNRKENQSTGI